MAISSPLLDIIMEGARGVLLNITGGPDLTLTEMNEAGEFDLEAADPERTSSSAPSSIPGRRTR